MHVPKQEVGSLPLGQPRAAEEMHSPWEHLDPTSGGLSTEGSQMCRPHSLQRDTDLLEGF